MPKLGTGGGAARDPGRTYATIPIWNRLRPTWSRTRCGLSPAPMRKSG